MNASTPRLLALAMALALPLRGADIVAVLSSGAAPYQQALEGLKSVAGDVPSAVLPAMPPMAGAKVVVTFGSDAATKDYPSDAALVAGLLPDPSLEIKHGGGVTKVGLPPSPSVLAAKIKALDPKVSTLAVLNPGSYGDYIDQLSKAASAAGFQLKVQKVDSLSDITDALPGLKGSVEGLWVPPDPLFMNPKTIGAIKDFAKGAGIAFFAPVAGLARAGAFAGVAPSFKQVGHAAGVAAQAYTKGSSPGDWVYCDQVEATVNKTVAGAIGANPAAGAADNSVE